MFISESVCPSEREQIVCSAKIKQGDNEEHRKKHKNKTNQRSAWSSEEPHNTVWKIHFGKYVCMYIEHAAYAHIIKSIAIAITQQNQQ